MNNFNGIDELILSISRSYSELKSAEKIVNIINKIRKGGSYKDIYEYASSIGLGDKLKEIITVQDWLDDRERLKEVSQALYDTMKEYSKDINDFAEVVQKAINDKEGINIAPQRVNAKNEQITSIIEGAIGENGSIDSLEGNILKFSATLTDEIIRKNADVQSKSGFDIVVIRTYDDVGIHGYARYADADHRKTIRAPRVCQFCKEREGTYNYDDVRQTGHKVWQRHQGCTCSIDFVNKGMTERVKNYV